MTYEESLEIDRLLAKQYPKISYRKQFQKFKNTIKEKITTLLDRDKKYENESEEEEVNQFSKVSIEQYIKDFLKQFPSESIGETAMIEEIYETIKLPKRSTSGSAGYDFFAPVGIKLDPEEAITIPTGIKCQIDHNWFLGLFPRSGLGFKYNMTLSNTLGVVDEDFYGNKDNEGHIMIKIINGKNKPLEIEQGKAFAQGIFLPYGLTVDDDAKGERTGGFGSTDKK